MMTPKRNVARTLLRAVLVLLCVHLTATAQPVLDDAAAPRSAPAVPASRQAELVHVITLQGPIDRFSALSVERRIAEAERAGADAIVLDIDSPGGEVGAVLDICKAIKSSPIGNSLGWVNDEAYSGGAIVALACRRLAANRPSSMGDALPIQIIPFLGAQRIPEELRPKIIPPVISELTDSARRNNYDEYLVQAIASDRIELWQIERIGSNPPERFTIDENEYRQIFEADPPRGKPMLGTIGESRAPQRPGAGDVSREPPGPGGDGPGGDGSGEGGSDGAATGQAAPPARPGLSEIEQRSIDEILEEAPPEAFFRPADEELADLTDIITAELFTNDTTTRTNRPIFDESQRGQWRLVSYVSDGTGPIVVGTDQLNPLGFNAAVILDDTELREYFGATTLVRVDESWSESLVRVMSSFWVRGILIALLLLGIFVEMISPGLVVPGGVALLAFAGLVVPPMLVGLAGWWEIVAILGGMALIAFEVFVTPGFGVFGVGGLIALFAGLIGTFTPNSPGAVPGLGSSGAFYGVVTTLLAFVTAGVVIFFISRNVKSVPVFSRLVLDSSSEDPDGTGTLLSAIRDEPAVVAPGTVGHAITDLRPVGRAEFPGDLVLDVYAEEGYLPDGAAVRVTGVTGLSVTVAAAPGHGDTRSNDPSNDPNDGPDAEPREDPERSEA